MLPEKYRWLETIGPLPKLVAAGLQYIGVKEIAGTANNPAIMDMAKGIGVENIYTNDSTIPWCALFINHLIRITGKPALDPKGDKWNLLRAKFLVNWGKPVARGEEKLGDIVIINRESGGHVCLFIAETDRGFIGLGGNQGNSVGFAEFESSRVLAVRRFYSTGLPASAKKYHMDSTGKMSTNEI